MKTALVQTINIQRRGEAQYFQFDMPLDVQRITGISVSVRLTTLKVANTKSIQAGNLTLQAEGRLNICYSTVVLAEQVAPTKADLGYTSFLAGFPASDFLAQNTIAQKTPYIPDALIIPKCSMMYGMYRDFLGKLLVTDTGYNVVITLWVEK